MEKELDTRGFAEESEAFYSCLSLRSTTWRCERVFFLVRAVPRESKTYRLKFRISSNDGEVAWLCCWQGYLQGCYEKIASNTPPLEALVYVEIQQTQGVLLVDQRVVVLACVRWMRECFLFFHLVDFRLGDFHIKLYTKRKMVGILEKANGAARVSRHMEKLTWGEICIFCKASINCLYIGNSLYRSLNRSLFRQCWPKTIFI